MSTGQMTVLRYIRTLVQAEHTSSMPDQEVLERFIARNDEGAFATLVHRHGPMVLRLCLRVLRNEQDAEDVFQATFLVLSQKAKSLKQQESVGSWLFGTAYHLALKTRVKSARREAYESRASMLMHEKPLLRKSVCEAQEMLDEELAKLPDEFRNPLVLCYLDGLTRDEAAQRLRCPIGTFKSRLERARKRLRARLLSRGVTFSEALVAALLCEGVASASVPPALIHSTVRTAAEAAARDLAAVVVSARVAALAKGALTSMFLTKLKFATSVLLVFGVIGAISILVQDTLATRALTPIQHVKTPANKQPQAPDVSGKGNPKPRILKTEGGVYCMAWSADGKAMAIVTHTLVKGEREILGEKKAVYETNSTVSFWDMEKGEVKVSLGEEKKVRIGSIAISRDAKLAAIAAVRDDGVQRVDPYEVRLIDPQTGALKNTIEQADPVRAVVLSPDGRTLAFGGSVLPTDLSGPFHRVVRMWDVEKGKVTSELKQELEAAKVLESGYLDGLRALVFSPDVKLLAAADADWRVRLIETQTGKVRQTLAGHTGVVLAVTFSPDGRSILTGSFDRTVKVWDVNTGKEMRTLPGAKGPVNSIAYSANGKLAAIGAVVENGKGSSEVSLWDTSTWESKKVLSEQSTVVSFAPGDGETLAVGGWNQIKLWPVRGVLSDSN